MDEDEVDSRYGWLVVAVSFCSMVFTWGTTFSFGVFLDPLAAEFGYSSVQLSTAFSLELLAFYGLAGVVGIAVSTVPVRPVVVGLSVLLAVLALLFASVSSYVGLVVLFAAMGTILGTMYVVLVSIVPQWFTVREGTAMGIIFAGNGLGMQVLPPVWELAIGSIGLRAAFRWMTLLTAGVFLVTGVVVRRPRTGDRTPRSERDDLTRWLASLLGRRRFWVAFFGAGLLFAWYYTFATHAVSLFTDLGFTRGVAATLFGLVGGVSVVARLTSGYLADRFGARRTIVVATAAASAGFFLLFSGSDALLYAAILCFGVGLGANATLYIPALMQGFTPERDTAFVGVFNFTFAVFAFLAPFTSSLAIEATGGYAVPFLAMGVLTLVGAGLFWSGTRPDTPRPSSADDSLPE
jgi:predicted MFS family arabinose efflux permease